MFIKVTHTYDKGLSESIKATGEIAKQEKLIAINSIVMVYKHQRVHAQIIKWLPLDCVEIVLTNGCKVLDDRTFDEFVKFLSYQ